MSAATLTRANDQPKHEKEVKLIVQHGCSRGERFRSDCVIDARGAAAARCGRGMDGRLPQVANRDRAEAALIAFCERAHGFIQRRPALTLAVAMAAAVAVVGFIEAH